jgi:hypothetical protein
VKAAAHPRRRRDSGGAAGNGHGEFDGGGVSPRRHGWLIIAAVPAFLLAAILAFSAFESLKRHRISHSTFLSYDRERNEWKKISSTNRPKFCELHLSHLYPWIWLESCPDVEDVVIPMEAKDDCSWVSRVPGSQEMISGTIYDMEPDGQYYDAGAQKFITFVIVDSKRRVIRPWYKLMNDGTIVEMK